MSDEAHFHLGVYDNKQICCIWGSENPKMIIEKPLYPQRVTVCGGFWAGGIIGPYFFENEAGAAVLVNGLRYRKMINEFLWPELEDMDNSLWNVEDKFEKKKILVLFFTKKLMFLQNAF